MLPTSLQFRRLWKVHLSDAETSFTPWAYIDIDFYIIASDNVKTLFLSGLKI